MFSVAFAFAVLAQDNSFQLIVDSAIRVHMESDHFRGRGRVVTVEKVLLKAEGATKGLYIERKGASLVFTLTAPDARFDKALGDGSIEIPAPSAPLKVSYDPVTKSYRFSQ